MRSKKTSAIRLNASEKKLRDALHKGLNTVFAHLATGENADAQAARALIPSLAQNAHDLHMRLSKRGFEPKHRQYMIRNRSVPPNDPLFYEHVHPIQDLLKFIDDPSANADPVDQTLGAEFTFDIVCRRWPGVSRFTFVRIENGWHIAYGAREGPCDPTLYECLKHDAVNFPNDLPGYLQHLWHLASVHGSGLSHEEVQEGLQQLADWVSSTDQASPSGVFAGYS